MIIQTLTPLKKPTFLIAENQHIRVQKLHYAASLFFVGFGSLPFSSVAFGTANARVDSAYIASLGTIGFGSTDFSTYSFGRGERSSHLTAKPQQAQAQAQTLGAI